MMNTRKLTALCTAAAFAAIGFASPASAQATRTWVSGVGDDVNPCSRTAPCKTFAGAISKTAAGGEINCLDPGGFGAVTINKSLTIDCHFTEGGALAGGNGIVVNALSTDVVTIRGLDIFGVSPPSNGVRILVAQAVHIEDCVIRRFNAANSAGVSIAPSGTTQVFITNTTIAQNGNGATGGGIVIQPTGSGTAKVTMRDVRSYNNANAGLRINTTGNVATGMSLSIEDSSFSGNTGQGIDVLSPAGTNAVTLTIDRSQVANNTGTGIKGDGPVSFLIGDSSIVSNSTGVSGVNGTSLFTYNDNRLNGNSVSDGTMNAPPIPKH
jgi:hypothetical protein